MTEQDVIDQPTNALTVAVRESGLTEKSAADLLAVFQPFFNEAYPIVRGAENVVVTDATQLTEMKQAHAMRMQLRDIRVAAEKARKATGDESLRMTKAINKVAGVVKAFIEPAEDRLLEAETFAERVESARKTRVRAEREELLKPFGIDTAYYDLASMTEPVFAQLLDSTRTAHEAKARAAAEAAEKIKREAEERAAEEKRIREENTRLQRENEAKERAARAEREKHEAELRRQRETAEAERRAAEEKARKEREAVEARERAERAAREKAEHELKARKAAEEKAAKAKAAEELRAAKAPDAEKLRAYAVALKAVPEPKCSDLGARAQAQAVDALALTLETIDRLAADLEV